MPEQNHPKEDDKQTEALPDYLLPKPLRQVFWIIGGLAFYGQFTISLLADVAISEVRNASHFSAWLTLAELEWSTPAKVFISSRDAIVSAAPSALLGAAIGSLALFVLAALRHTRFTQLILLSCIPFSVAATLSAFMGIGWHVLDQDLPPFGENTASVADSLLEVFLGVTLPLLIYGMSFCLAFFTGLAQLAIRKRSERSNEASGPTK
jgi:hypothetical protein